MRIAALILLAFFFAAERASAQSSESPKSLADKAGKTDLYGDPLPAGAIARLGTVRLRDGDGIVSVMFSPDGKTLASLGHREKPIRVWDTATGCETRHIEGDWRQLAFSADGRSFSAISADGTLIQWDVRGKVLREQPTHHDSIDEAALSPDGTRVVAVDADNAIRLRDAATGRQLHRLTGHKNPIQFLLFSDNGKVLASGNHSKDNFTRIWDVTTGRELRRFKLGEDLGLPLALSPDGKILVSKGEEQVDWWDVVAGKKLRSLPDASCATFTHDGRLLATTSTDGFLCVAVCLWRVADGKQIRKWKLSDCIRAIAFSPDDKRLAIGGDGGAIRLFDVASGEELHAGRGHVGLVEKVIALADGRGVVTCGEDNSIFLWDGAAGRRQRRFALPQGSPHALACSPDGRTLAALTGDPRPALHLWDAVSGAEIRRWDVKGVKFYTAVAFALDGKTLVTGGDEGALSVWDVATGKSLSPLRARRGDPVTELAVSPDGRWLAARIGFGALATFGGSAKIHLWNLATGRDHPLRQQPNILSAPAFSPDGKTLAALEEFFDPRFHHNVLHLWEVESGLPRRLKLKRVGDVSAFALAPGGEVLATAESRRIRLWDIADDTELRHFDGHRGDINALAFSPDGRTLISGSADTTALVWDVSDLVNGRKRRLVDLSQGQLEALWGDLKSEDAARAGESIWKLIAGRQTVAFLKEHLHPVSAPDARRVAGLIADLDGSDFAVRQRATRQLEKLGEKAFPALRRARADRPSLEMRRRIESILERQLVMDMRLLRAIEVLERIGDCEARQVLQTLADGLPGVRLTQEAKASLRRLEKRPSRQ